jgi:hypothetical protein
MRLGALLSGLGEPVSRQLKMDKRWPAVLSHALPNPHPITIAEHASPERARDVPKPGMGRSTPEQW